MHQPGAASLCSQTGAPDEIGRERTKNDFAGRKAHGRTRTLYVHLSPQPPCFGHHRCRSTFLSKLNLIRVERKNTVAVFYDTYVLIIVVHGGNWTTRPVNLEPSEGDGHLLPFAKHLAVP